MVLSSVVALGGHRPGLVALRRNARGKARRPRRAGAVCTRHLFALLRAQVLRRRTLRGDGCPAERVVGARRAIGWTLGLERRWCELVSYAGAGLALAEPVVRRVCGQPRLRPKLSRACAGRGLALALAERAGAELSAGRSALALVVLVLLLIWGCRAHERAFPCITLLTVTAAGRRADRAGWPGGSGKRLARGLALAFSLVCAGAGAGCGVAFRSRSGELAVRRAARLDPGRWAFSIAWAWTGWAADGAALGDRGADGDAGVVEHSRSGCRSISRWCCSCRPGCSARSPR